MGLKRKSKIKALEEKAAYWKDKCDGWQKYCQSLKIGVKEVSQAMDATLIQFVLDNHADTLCCTISKPKVQELLEKYQLNSKVDGDKIELTLKEKEAQ